MIYLLISLGVFLLTAGVHFFVHRVLASRGVFTVWIFGIYLLGLIVNGILLFFLDAPFSLLGSVLFGVLMCDMIVVSMTPFLGDESPTSKIALLVEKKRKMKKEEMVHVFSNHMLFDKRISDMQKAGWIIKREGQYFATEKGVLIAKVVSWYRRVLGVA